MAVPDRPEDRGAGATEPLQPPETDDDERLLDRFEEQPRSRALHLMRDAAFVVAVAIVVSALLRAFVLQAFMVPTGSMERTIGTDQRILVTKFGEIERGQIVVFQDPSDWITLQAGTTEPPGPIRSGLEWVGLLPSSADDHLVKRVVGMPGDRVVCCDNRGRVSVNGQALKEDSYLFPGDEASEAVFDVTVPRGAMWVMGDHRSDSGDSRCHLADGTAFVPLDLVTGRAVATIWPFEDLATLGVPQTYTGVPTPSNVPADPVVTTPSDCVLVP
ncbi:MAG: signal peptidase I [Actinomycetota bacterium]|nr:signal peptidase I [Actinomycetota bacterium]